MIKRNKTRIIAAVIMISVIIISIIIVSNDAQAERERETVKYSYSSGSSYNSDKKKGVSNSAYNSGQYYYATHEPQYKNPDAKSRQNLKGNAHGYAFWDEISG